ncbi:DUF4342 domain-containing protein [Peptoniphilus sp. oral taxon 386]|uniref:DUF4342 domain-containing protein n=1 Tax=Peptoniphilus sp. oral taxon 386 TaxID=652713 RepID=UPI0001DA9B62|nr:DUF4342 domain-containing protein [Peptoniphilus sp. oral taxon 386]EFI42347.1 UBA/TS-N domain protein [Peptoniphilus sp. oral taxon 386 str. F0131]
MITMEKIDYVMDVTNSSYDVVRRALLDSDGDVDLAVDIIRKSVDTSSKKSKDTIDFEDIKDAIKEIWNQGNANKLVVKKDGDIVLSLSLTVSALGIILAPVAALVGVGAGIVNDYEFKIILSTKEEIDIKEYIKCKSKTKN